MATLAEREREPDVISEVYEWQLVSLTGFVWRETFPGRPNYQCFKTDENETYWMLILAHPISLIAIHPEHGGSYRREGIKRLQMLLTKEQYDHNRFLVLRDAHVHGRLFPSISGHHHGDANIEVSTLSPA
ncbi:hypothetical protein [Pseudolysobacter antarcticus]|nr:hypothetical protein [Pseudolysobacter antarcticus]